MVFDAKEKKWIFHFVGEQHFRDNLNRNVMLNISYLKYFMKAEIEPRIRLQRVPFNQIRFVKSAYRETLRRAAFFLLASK